MITWVSEPDEEDPSRSRAAEKSTERRLSRHGFRAIRPVLRVPNSTGANLTTREGIFADVEHASHGP